MHMKMFKSTAASAITRQPVSVKQPCKNTPKTITKQQIVMNLARPRRGSTRTAPQTHDTTNNARTESPSVMITPSLA
jgi:hypothetical protein